jgi:LRP1 type putative zinc finger protein
VTETCEVEVFECENHHISTWIPQNASVE